MTTAAAKPIANGHLSEPELTDFGAIPTRRVLWVDVPDQETYPGYQVKLWVNPTNRFLGEYGSMDPNVFRPLRPQLILDHRRVDPVTREPILLPDGRFAPWVDYDGRVIPPTGPSVAEWDAFWTACPADLVLAVTIFAVDEARSTRNFPKPTPMDSKPT